MPLRFAYVADHVAVGIDDHDVRGVGNKDVVRVGIDVEVVPAAVAAEGDLLHQVVAGRLRRGEGKCSEHRRLQPTQPTGPKVFYASDASSDFDAFDSAWPQVLLDSQRWTYRAGRFENQLLHAPIQKLADIEFVLRRAGDFVNPAELLELLAGAAEIAQHFAVQAELVDAARDRRPSCTGTDSGPGVMQMAQGAPGACVPVTFGPGLLPMAGTGVGRNGHVDGDLAKEFAVAVEHLDAAVAAVGHVDVPLRVGRDAVRRVELAGLVAGLAPGLEPVAVLIDFRDARIDVAVADVGVAGGIPGHVGHLAEHARRRPAAAAWGA